MTSGGIEFTNFPENQSTALYAFFLLVFFVHFAFTKVDIM